VKKCKVGCIDIRLDHVPITKIHLSNDEKNIFVNSVCKDLWKIFQN
jgi:hypothetical protein